MKRLALLFALIPSLACAQLVPGPQTYTAGAGIIIAPPIVSSTITQYTDGQAAAAAPIQSVNGLTGTVSLNVPLYATGCTPTSPCAIATALASPCGSATLGYVARVNNLFNGSGSATNASMTCVVNGTIYNWHPNIIDNAMTLACSGTITITPYTTPTTQVCTAATLAANLVFNIAASPTPWCGESANISTSALTPVLNTVTLNIAGTLLKTLGVGSYSAVYACTNNVGGWVVR